MTMLANEPLVDLTGHDEMDASEVLEAMYLADEERRQEEVLIGWPVQHQAAAGPSPLSDMDCDGTEALGVIEQNSAEPCEVAPSVGDAGCLRPVA